MGRTANRLIDNKVRKESKEVYELNKSAREFLGGERLKEHAPKVLNDEAKEVYKDLRKLNEAVGLGLSQSDLSAIISYCDTYVEVQNIMRERDALVELLKGGYNKDYDDALDKKRKALNSAKKLLSQCRKEVGLDYTKRLDNIKKGLNEKYNKKEAEKIISLFDE